MNKEENPVTKEYTQEFLFSLKSHFGLLVFEVWGQQCSAPFSVKLREKNSDLSWVLTFFPSKKKPALGKRENLRSLCVCFHELL